MTMQDYANINAQNGIRNVADSAAQQTYYDALARGQDQSAALAAAKFAWQQKLDEATQTGMWNGQWNMPTNQWFTGQFGTWDPNGPQAGQETLQKNQQDYQQAFNLSQLYGQYYAPGSTPGAGTQTQQAQQQAFAQQAQLAQMYGGYYGAGQTPGAGAQTLAQQNQNWQQNYQAQQLAMQNQNQQQQQSMAYLQLLSQLRGPADYAKYQQVLGSTPQGMRDLTAAAMGQYIPGGGATTGVQPQAANLNTMQQQVAGTGTAQEATGGGANLFGTMPAPNQIAAQSWKNLAPSQQQMLLGGYEAQGWNKDDVTALMNQSLPKYATNAPGAGTWRLQ